MEREASRDGGSGELVRGRRTAAGEKLRRQKGSPVEPHVMFVGEGRREEVCIYETENSV